MHQVIWNCWDGFISKTRKSRNPRGPSLLLPGQRGEKQVDIHCVWYSLNRWGVLMSEKKMNDTEEGRNALCAMLPSRRVTSRDALSHHLICCRSEGDLTMLNAIFDFFRIHNPRRQSFDLGSIFGMRFSRKYLCYIVKPVWTSMWNRIRNTRRDFMHVRRNSSSFIRSKLSRTCL